MLEALLPIICLLTLGYVCKHAHFLPDEGWRAMERISYYIFFPALIINVLQAADLGGVPIGYALSFLVAQSALGLVGLLAVLTDGKSPRSVGSIVQSNVRWNTFVALAISENLLGVQGVALVAIAAAVLIPLSNLFSVSALLHFSGRDGAAQGSILGGLVKNPLLIACAVGIGLSVSNVTIPAVALDTLDLLSRPAISLGLVTAGAGVTFRSFSTRFGRSLFWSLVRLLLYPLIGVAVGIGFAVSELQLTVIAICCATPTAVNGYILAKELGGDADLSANLISLQTVMSAFTLPLVLALVAIAAPA